MSESHTKGVHTIVIHLNGDGSNGNYSSSNNHHTEESSSEKLITNGSKLREVYTPDDNPPPSRFPKKCHPRADEICAELDAFFAKHWPWENERAREKFLASDTNRWACWSLPFARDDRMFDGAKVNTLFFLLDGKLLPLFYDQNETKAEMMETSPNICQWKKVKHSTNASSPSPRVKSCLTAQMLTNGLPMTCLRACVPSTRSSRRSSSKALCCA